MDEKSSDLAVLEAHGLAFLQSFGISSLVGTKRTAGGSGMKHSKKRKIKEQGRILLRPKAQDVLKARVARRIYPERHCNTSGV